jgi:hypothetical protein
MLSLDRWFLLAVAPLAVLQACERIVAVSIEDTRTPPNSTAASECVVDDDCGLMPSMMTCCGECDPAPPFEAVPRTAIDARLIELETSCGETSVVCEDPVCEIAPAGCVARAICLNGVCRVIESGCAALVADTQ